MSVITRQLNTPITYSSHLYSKLHMSSSSPLGHLKRDAGDIDSEKDSILFVFVLGTSAIHWLQRYEVSACSARTYSRSQAWKLASKFSEVSSLFSWEFSRAIAGSYYLATLADLLTRIAVLKTKGISNIKLGNKFNFVSMLTRANKNGKRFE